MNKIALGLFSAGTVLALVCGFGSVQHWGELFATLLVAGLWLAAQWRRHSRALLVTSLAMAALAILAALENVTALLVVPGWCGLLGAWDLAELRRRLVYSQDEAMQRRLESNHVRKLLLILGAGAIVALGVASMQLRLMFGGVIVIGLLSVGVLWGLTMILARQSQMD